MMSGRTPGRISKRLHEKAFLSQERTSRLRTICLIDQELLVANEVTVGGSSSAKPRLFTFVSSEELC